MYKCYVATPFSHIAVIPSLRDLVDKDYITHLGAVNFRYDDTTMKASLVFFVPKMPFP